MAPCGDRIRKEFTANVGNPICTCLGCLRDKSGRTRIEVVVEEIGKSGEIQEPFGG